jgi:hypothetical protein
MIKTKINRIRVRLRNLQSRLDRKMSENEKMNEIQKSSYSICRRMICNHDSMLTYAPLTGTYYVENSHYYIRFCDSSVTITNGKFSYYIWMPGNMVNDLIKLFNRVSQSRSNSIEKRYSEHTLKNLNEIYNSLETLI